MKKFLLSLIIFSLVFAFGGIVLAEELMTGQNELIQPRANINATSSLEKIANPGQMSLFTKIQKIGTALFGVRKPQNNQKPGQTNASQPNAVKPNGQGANQQNTSSSTNQTLEKISSPAEISLFEKIKKVGTALWGIRKENKEGKGSKDGKEDNNQKPVINQPKPVYVTPAAAQCVKDAIDKKDTAAKTSTNNHAQKVSSAIDARGTCQKATLDQTTAKAQADANKVCVDTFQKSLKEINIVMETEKKATFEAYRTDLKICSALQTGSASTSTPNVSAELIMIPDEVVPVVPTVQSDDQPAGQIKE